MNPDQNITDPNQLPQPFTNDMLRTREQERRQRFLSDPFGTITAGTTDALTGFQYAAQNIYNTLQGSSQDEAENQRRQQAINELERIREQGRYRFNEFLRDILVNNATYRQYIRQLNQSDEYREIYNNHFIS